MTGIPGLSEIPVLGLLFARHSDAKEEVEGAVFIVPSIVETPQRAAFDMIRDAMKQYDAYSGDIDAVESFPKRPSIESMQTPGLDRAARPSGTDAPSVAPPPAPSQRGR